MNTKETTLSYNANIQVNGLPITVRRHERWQTQDLANRRIKILLQKNKESGQIKYTEFRTQTTHHVSTQST